MYGIALDASGINEVELVLKDGARLGDLIAELRNKVPELDGPVIESDKNILVGRCLFNIDGRFYFGEEDTELRNGVRVRLLTLATGG